MERNLFKYVWRHSRGDQLKVLVIVLLSYVFYYLSLDIPKTIIDKAIRGDSFKDGPTVPFMAIKFTVPDWLGFAFTPGPVTVFSGIEVTQIPYLFSLSALFLLFVLINNSMKSKINTEKGRLGERMLRRLRFELFDRILRFPPQHFRKVKPAEMATMIKDEVEPLGGFIGDAFIQPAFQGGLALTALFFILSQNLYLGLLSVVTLIIQFALIPRLRKRLLVLGKQRQITARELAGRIAECVDGAYDIHVNGTGNYERADIVQRLARIFDIRFELYKRKFTIKAINNFLNQFTPFLYYSIGGYLVIVGDIELGALVAILAAYKDLPSPIKELIDWDQQRQDVQIKYEQVVDQFGPAGLIDQSLHDATAPVETLDGPLNLSTVVAEIEGDGLVLDGVSAEIDLDRFTAVIGPAGGGKEYIGLVAARLLEPLSGSVKLGGRDLMTLPASTLGRAIAYIGQEPYIFPMSIRANVTYGLQLSARNLNPEGNAELERAVGEARRTGTPPFDAAGDWTDYETAGAQGPEEMENRILDVLRQVEMEDDIYQFGLRGRIDPQAQPELAAKLVAARGDLQRHLREQGLAQLVEPFDRDKYNRNMSVVENLLFGTPIGQTFDSGALESNDYLNTILSQTGLHDDLVRMGRKIAETMIELFADLPPGHPFFDQFSFIAADDLPEFRALLGRLDKPGVDTQASDRQRLIGLAFPYIEARHRLDLVNAQMEQKILEARRSFAENLPEPLKDAIEFYDATRYNANASLQDNILFGRLVHGQAQAENKIGAAIANVIEAGNLKRAVMGVGLDYQTGTAGKRLTTAQRQKIGIARALIKRPRLLIVNQATALFDNAGQQRLLQNILKFSKGRGIIWILHRPDFAQYFSRVLVMENGHLVEQGTHEDLNRPGTAYHALAAAAA